jgi:NDP-sugar pyrophosphorylase family protein
MPDEKDSIRTSTSSPSSHPPARSAPEPAIRRAVVLAAGRGTRMGGITAETPKAMLLVQGRPLVERVLESFAAAGVEEFLIVVGYRREAIEEHLRNWRLPITFRIQDPIDGTGSAARLARDFAAGEPFLLGMGDILCEPAEYRRCAEVLLTNPNTQAVLGVKDTDDPFRAAAVYAEDGVIRHVIEKPPKGTSTTRWTSAGLYAMRPIAFHYLERLQPSPRNEYELTSIFEMMLADGLELRIAPIEGGWRDVGRPEDLEAANRG